MTTVRGFMWRMGGALGVLIVGLMMTFYALERMSLIRFAAHDAGAASAAPTSLKVTLFLGLVVMNTSLFFAITKWANYLRGNPGTRQAPVWMLVVVLVVCAFALVLAMATHSAYLATLAVIPLDVSWGYVLFQVIAASAALIALVLIGVRWSPGYRRRLGE